MTTRATPAAAAAVTTVCVPRTLSADRSATGVSSDQSTARCTTASAPGHPLREHGVAHVADAPGDLARAGRLVAAHVDGDDLADRRARRSGARSSARPMTPAAPVTTTVAPLRRLRGLRGDCTGTTGAAVPTSPAVAGSATRSGRGGRRRPGPSRLRGGLRRRLRGGRTPCLRRRGRRDRGLGGARVRSRGRRAHRGLGHRGRAQRRSDASVGARSPQAYRWRPRRSSRARARGYRGRHDPVHGSHPAAADAPGGTPDERQRPVRFHARRARRREQARERRPAARRSASTRRRWT